MIALSILIFDLLFPFSAVVKSNVKVLLLDFSIFQQKLKVNSALHVAGNVCMTHIFTTLKNLKFVNAVRVGISEVLLLS